LISEQTALYHRIMSSARSPVVPLGTAPRTPARVAAARRYLMCPPRYFTVSYTINPWMDPSRPVHTARAMAQWTALADTYRTLGHTIEMIDPQPGLPDMVFAANAGTVLDGVVLGARFRHAQRRAEAQHYRRWFVGHGLPDLVLPHAINEGEGDLLWTGRLLLAGTGFRTEPAAHLEAQEVLGVPVVSLRLVDPRYYHLDTCLLVLDTSPAAPLIAYFPGAFSPGSQRALAKLFPDAVLAGATDAACLGLNGVSDGRSVVLPHEAVDLGRALAARSFEPVFVDISELRRAGGGPKCCTLELRP
jgi:N-dimethylarginine dimethylaminohydrolase